MTVDITAINGLRGLAAVHVMASHFLMSRVLLLGALEMPLFYLISGFTLTIVYRKSVQQGNLDCRKFYQNRFARTAPSFYLANLLTILMYDPLFGINHSSFFIRCVFTLTITNSWFTFLNSNDFSITPFHGPSWTISTLSMMYLLYPWFIHNLEKLSSREVTKTMNMLHCIQLAPLCFCVVAVTNGYIDSDEERK